MKRLYCSQCGKLLRWTRKAVNGTVIDCVDPHECISPPLTPEEALEDVNLNVGLDTNTNSSETENLGSFIESLERKFPQTNEPPHVDIDDTFNEATKRTSTAPKNVLEQLKKQTSV